MPTHATISDSQGVGTITNDDAAPSFAIDNVSHNEGDTGTTSYVFTVTKTGATELIATVSYATGGGTATAGASCATAGVDYISKSDTLTFLPGETSKTITVLVCGDNLAESTETFNVVLSGATEATVADGTGVGTITNEDAAPTVSAGGPYSGSEGSNVPLNGTVNDADGDTTTLAWTYAITTADVGTTCGFTPNAMAEDPSFRCSDDGTFKVRLTASDGTNTTWSEADVTLSNANPIITASSATSTPLPLLSSASASATFNDPGTNDIHTCVINWDDGTTTAGAVSETNGAGTCSGTHPYAGAGVYTITITVSDDDGGSASVTVSTYVVVYDPGAGFVTGGGWIMVEAGSCKLAPLCLGATGRANFGFTSQYKKTAPAGPPTGETEFQFQAGDLNFHSEVYQWLVVTGSKAQYQGTGTINGATGYSFLLTAYDQNPDKFRIKIWRTVGGAVVFDSRMGVSDDIDAANPQGISGGSIVIHK
jgi:hypothetical protein